MTGWEIWCYIFGHRIPIENPVKGKSYKGKCEVCNKQGIFVWEDLEYGK